MISINDKAQCVGCGNCIKVCSRKCLSAFYDEDGLMYPVGNEALCNYCGLCHKVCPVENKVKCSHPIYIAARNLDDKVRMSSSSGGVFYELAKSTIDDGGIVYGAAYSPEGADVEHIMVNAIDELYRLQKSKYVQSSLDKVLLRDLRNSDCSILFSGTPCQIKAIYLLLKPEIRDKILFVEIACHGVPKTADFHKFIKNNDIVSIDFRNKEKGLSKNEIVMKHSDGSITRELSSENIFYQSYIACESLRPSCFSCPAKNFSSGADITLGDFWGIKQFAPEMFDDKGASVVLLHTKKGIEAWNNVKDKFEFGKISKIAAIKNNPCIIRSSLSKPTLLERIDGYKWIFKSFIGRFVKK